jgi:hypothetical protein
MPAQKLIQRWRDMQRFLSRGILFKRKKMRWKKNKKKKFFNGAVVAVSQI